MDIYIYIYGHIWTHMHTYAYICIHMVCTHMDTCGGPRDQTLARNWRRTQMGQGPGTLPPILGQGLALGPHKYPYVCICMHTCLYVCVHMCPYTNISISGA